MWSLDFVVQARQHIVVLDVMGKRNASEMPIKLEHYECLIQCWRFLFFIFYLEKYDGCIIFYIFC